MLTGPMHWSVAGVIIGLTVPALMLIDNKRFGLSSGFKHLCAMCVPIKVDYFNYDWKKEAWLFIMIGGIIFGAYLGGVVFANPDPVALSVSTQSYLSAQGINPNEGLNPIEIFAFDKLGSAVGWIFMVIGGFIVGFGTRYAEGCTSGHSIYGLATLQWPSLIATLCFMFGGIVSTHFLLPILLKLLA
jgi:uncharacterized protein